MGQEEEKVTLDDVPAKQRPVLVALWHRTYLTSREIAEKLKVTEPAARSALNRLRKCGLVRIVKGEGRSRLYHEYGLGDLATRQINAYALTSEAREVLQRDAKPEERPPPSKHLSLHPDVAGYLKKREKGK